MKTIMTTLVVLIALTVNAQDFKSLSFVSKVNGPMMLDSIEIPDMLPSDVVREQEIFFNFDMEDMTFTFSTLKKKAVFDIVKTYKSKQAEDGYTHYTSRAFEVDKVGVVVITFCVDIKDAEDTYFTVQIEKEYNETYTRPWYVDLYYIQTKEANFVK